MPRRVPQEWIDELEHLAALPEEDLPTVDLDQVERARRRREEEWTEDKNREAAAQALRAGIFVPGHPAAFANGARTSEWQDKLDAAIPIASKLVLAFGIEARFILPRPRAGAVGADLDNLLDPVFSRVVNKKRWFGERRSNVLWVAAVKEHGDEPGARISVGKRSPPGWIDRRRRVALKGSYEGPVPKRGEATGYNEWVKSSMRRELRDVPVGVDLRIADPSVNLGDIADGVVKAVVDGLWPILGGSSGRPHDHWVHRLLVQKGTQFGTGIEVSVHEVDP